MLKKILAILVALATVLSLAACGNYEININKVEDETQAEEAENNEEAKEDGKKEDKEDEVDVTKKEQKKDDGKISKKLSAKKIGTIKDDDQISYTLCDGGFIYKKNGKYGIMSLDGKKDTGAKYIEAEAEGDYFKVVDKQPGETVEEQNYFTLIDANGKEVIPGKFATFNILNDRYIRVVAVNKLVDNKDDALVYETDNQYSLGAGDGDTLYGGNWYVYDVRTGKQVPGVTGTQGYSIYVYGDIIEYVTDTSKTKYVNAKGEELPEDADVFNNGCYIIDDKSSVFDSEGNEVFDYDPTSYVPYNTTGDDNEYYIGSLYINGNSEYVLMDSKGQKINDLKFEKIPSVTGCFINCDGAVYTLEGKKVAVEDVYGIYSDEFTYDYYTMNNDTTYYLVDAEGNVIHSCDKNDDSFSVTSYNCSFSKKIDGKSNYYCVADEDYSVVGYSVIDAWLITEDVGNGYENLVDLISGETLLEKYEDYESQLVEGVGTYVYADNGEGKIEVYLVTAA